MRRLAFSFVLAFLLIAPFPGPASSLAPIPGAADILAAYESGDSTLAALEASGYPSCTSNAAAPCYKAVTATEFLLARLEDHRVLFVGTHRTGTLYTALLARQGDIATYVENGGSLLALAEPDGQGYTFSPLRAHVFTAANRPEIADEPTDGQGVVITNYGAGHPAMIGLTDAQLTGWNSSWDTLVGEHNSSLGELAQGHYATDPQTAERHYLPATLAGNYGDGCVTLTTLRIDEVAAGQSNRSGDAQATLRAHFRWALDCTPAPPIPAPFGGFIRLTYSNGRATVASSAGIRCGGLNNNGDTLYVDCAPTPEAPPGVEWYCAGAIVHVASVGLTALRGSMSCADGTAAVCDAPMAGVAPYNTGSCAATNNLAFEPFPVRCLARMGEQLTPDATWIVHCGPVDP